jgi:hypothetical protein
MRRSKTRWHDLLLTTAVIPSCHLSPVQAYLLLKTGENDVQEDDDNDDDEGDESIGEEESEDDAIDLEIVARVYDSQEAWHDGKVAQVHTDKAGNITYDIDYDDGRLNTLIVDCNRRIIFSSITIISRAIQSCVVDLKRTGATETTIQ